MEHEKCSPEEAAEILIKAKEIQADPVQFKAAQEVLKKKSSTISSIADLKKMSQKGLTMKDLLTEEDKVALKEKLITDGKMAEMGFMVKEKVDMADSEEESEEEEEND